MSCFCRHRISIHALREEGDPSATTSRATWGNFYPRPPRGGRRGRGAQGKRPFAISIHALREEGDVQSVVDFVKLFEFLSTPSARRATSVRFRSYPHSANFYPRPPRGGRRFAPATAVLLQRFLSTPSARRATTYCFRSFSPGFISIHALREEGDCSVYVQVSADVHISIHALREEGDCSRQMVDSELVISIHALREEGDSKNGESIPAFDQSINQAAQNGKSCERKTFLKLEICAERQAFPGAKVPGI